MSLSVSEVSILFYYTPLFLFYRTMYHLFNNNKPPNPLSLLQSNLSSK